jgi:saccharopine dehydrogenase-like NADP-dependent oxidoreductase
MEKTKVLIVGAGGLIARHVIQFLTTNENGNLTLFLRDASQLK